MVSAVEVRHLQERDLVGGFRCGVNALDYFLRKHARQNHRAGTSVTWVAVLDGRIVGFVTIVASSLPSKVFSGVFAELPPYDVPVLVLARMATAKDLQGTGCVGPRLMRDAVFSTALGMAPPAPSAVGCIGVFVEAKSDRAANFYRKYGFADVDVIEEACASSHGRRTRMFVPLGTVRVASVGAWVAR